MAKTTNTLRKLIFIALLAFLSSSVFSQTLKQGFNIMRGRSVDFTFRSLSEIENGKSLGTAPIGFTEIYIVFDTTGGFFAPEVTGWELCLYSNSPSLNADFGSPNLDLTKIMLNTQMVNGVGTAVASSFLTANPNNVIASADMGDGVNGGVEWTVTIAWDCAKEAGFEGLIGVNPDFYYTDLIIYIRPVYA